MYWFYTQQLGLPVQQHTSTKVVFLVGWTQFVFRQVDVPTNPYHFAFNVPLHTLEQYQLWFDLPYFDAGSPGCRIANFPDWKARASYFFDPDGNIVEFIERRDAACEESANGYFQCISEIGLMNEDVKATTDWLQQAYGLSLFTKSKPMPDFAAIGDDYGLIILAKTGRPWLFTDCKAMPSRWRMEIVDPMGNRTLVDSNPV